MAAINNQPAPKPQSLGKPVPKSAAEEEAAAFMAEYEAPKISMPASAEAAAFEGGGTSAPVAAEEPGIAGKALDATVRTLDYPGGFVRSGLAEVAGIATGQPGVVTPEDIGQAAVGKAPSSEEYLRRLGVPEGWSTRIGGEKITARGAAGLAADIATDPLTAIGKAIKAAPYLKKLINMESKTGVANKAAEALGEAVYKSAYPKGAEAAAEVMIKEGAPIGGAVKIAQNVEELSNSMGKLRQGLYDRATELGVTIDTAYPLRRTEALLKAMRRDPGLAPAVGELDDLLARYKSAGKVPIDVMSEWKTNLYDSLPASAFNNGKLKGHSKAFKAALAADFRETIVKAGDAAELGLGRSIDEVNEKWGALLSATRPLEKATEATGGRLGLIIDGAVAATGGISGYAAKKGYDIATSPGVKTMVGRALMEAGKKDLASRTARQGLIELERNRKEGRK